MLPAESLAAQTNRELPAAALVLDLVVDNHPGVMSHITGLFARRAFNLEGILCGPVGDGARSRMLLLVCPDPRVEQLVLQLRKLHDVVEVRLASGVDPALFRSVVAQSTPCLSGGCGG